MPDHVLPWPEPNWAHPQTSDAPTPEQVQALAQLRELSQALPSWLSLAAVGPLHPRRWREIAAMLAEKLRIVGEQDTDPITVYAPATITVLPHQGVTDVDGILCARCGLPLTDDIHSTARHRLDPRTP